MNPFPEFSDLLSRQLAQRDRSPAWLARRLDLHPGTVSRWLNQRTRPATPELVIRVADVLGVHTPTERQALMAAAGFAYVEEGATPAPASVPRATPAHAQPPPSRLPVAQTSFVGRERELEQIAERLDNEGARLQTILGAGGIGKTSLALQAAKQNGEKFRDGVFFVSVAGLSSPDEVAVAILTTINAPERNNISFLQQLCDNLCNQRILLILDNFEDVPSAAALVAEFLRAAPGVHVMVTSRERLNLVNEWLVPLGPLPYPARNQIETDDGIVASEYAALHLFALCAKKLVPSFSLESSNLKIVTEICRLVDGFPLAIEMAAAWVRSLSVAEIADEIQQGLDFLVAQSRDALQRHSSMRVVMDHSWQLLSPTERNAMTRLSVFRGGFTRHAAQAVAEASLLDLSGLMDKSWIQMTPAGRYDAHRLALHYAATKLAEANPAPATNPAPDMDTDSESVKQVLARHAHYFASLIPEDWHLTAIQAAIGNDIDNVRLAWQSSIDQQLWYEMNRLIPAIAIFTHVRWSLVSPHQLDEVVSMLEATQRQSETLSATDRQLILLLEAKVRFTIGEYQNHRGHFDEALVQMHRSRQLFSDLIKDKPEVRLEAAFVARELGYTYYNIGVFDKAERFYMEALQIKGDGDFKGRGVYQLLMLLYDRLGRYVESNKYAKLELENETAAGATLAHIRRTYIRTLTNQGHYAEARKMQAESVEHTDSRYHGHWLRHVGNLARAGGDAASALPLLQESLAIAQREGEQSGESDTWLELGTTYLALEQYQQAHEAFEQGLALAQKIGRGRNIPVALTGLARTALLRGHHALARDYLRQAVDASATNIVPPDLLDTMLAFAQWHVNAGRTAQASQYLKIVVGHPATVHENRQQAKQLLRTLENGLLPQVEPQILPELENPQLENMVTLSSKDLATWG